MAKKKKSQLKPVVRGFATTSVPKKVSAVSDVEENVETPLPESEHQKIVESVASGQSNTRDVADDFNPDQIEEQSLQNLVDKLQEKTEREITRTIKAIEMERRLAISLPRFELDSSVVERILQLAIESEEGIRKPLEESEEKVIAKLGISYGVLRRLGFTESRVEECLNAINGVGLDEAYEWLYLHCEEGELSPPKSEPIEARPPRTPGAACVLPPPESPLTSSHSSEAPVAKVSKRKQQLNANALIFVPSDNLALDGSEWIDPTSEITSIGPGSLKLDLEEDFSYWDDPNTAYVKLKLRIAALTAPRRKPQEVTDSYLIQKLLKQLDAVKSDYLFDADEAEPQYRAEQDEVDKRSLEVRLRSVPVAPSEIETKVESNRRPPNLQPQAAASSSAKVDIFDEDREESTGGLFEILENMPATETTNEGTTIVVRDMALPKHWSGRTPKVFLAEAVAKKDRYAAISYSNMPGSSRAKRATLRIRWEGHKIAEWRMDDVGCYDMKQAEQYVATVALHALTFPSMEGFAASPSPSGGTQTFFRLLPPAFRNVWEELEVARKTRDDITNRSVWAKLRSIIEAKQEISVKQSDRTNRHILDVKSNYTSGTVHHQFADTAMEDFNRRRASEAYQDMMAQRNMLPIAQYREEIISVLESSQILVLSGETGCGKSTQVPAFILENQLSRGKLCKIYCTEPRRISAISLAQRVSRELGDAPGAVGSPSSLVGYSIRLESNTSKNTRLAYITNGIALRMLEGGSGQGGQGTAFDEITHIIIDEVHERTIESDFLMIVLKSLLEQRSDLRVILMSATVDADKISQFFGGCPTLHVPGRTFPVRANYLEDAVEYTKWSISENSPYARRHFDKYYRNKNRADWSEDLTAGDDDEDGDVQEKGKLEKRYSPTTASTINLFDERLIPYELIVRLLERICFEDAAYESFSSAILIFMPGLAEIRRLNDMLAEHRSFGDEGAFRVFPLHSTISSENQAAVFDIPPSGVRKIVIATNIAETGITIPDIRVVIDTGKHREMRFDEKRQISRLIETFIARSNAAQRRGRAGRVQEGLCFHLFTKLRHDTQMAEHPLPEMMRLSLSDLALRIKIMKIKLGTSIEDVLGRAMDPPVPLNVQRAISSLVEVRALTPSEEITPMGRLLSKLPTDVHLGKFLLIATLTRCLDPALTIAATLNSKSPFITPFGLEQEADRARNSFRIENSDFLTIHNAFSIWRRASANPSFVRKFCKTNFLSHQNLQQIEELRQQFLGYLIDSAFIQVPGSFLRDLSRARYGRARTRFVTVPPQFDSNSGNFTVVSAALVAGLYPKLLSIDPSSGQMRTLSNNQSAAFHPSSVNFGRRPSELGTRHLTYFTLMQSSKLYAWETGPVDDIALLLLCGECEFRLISDTAIIDRKIKFHISPKSNIALKHLRGELASLLALQFRGKVLAESQLLWNDIAMQALGKQPNEEAEKSAIVVC